MNIYARALRRVPARTLQQPLPFRPEPHSLLLFAYGIALKSDAPLCHDFAGAARTDFA